MTEHDLCEAFAAQAREEGWTVHPETAGWDMLCVKDCEVVDAVDGKVVERTRPVQLGVEAKLRANVDVLAQAIKPRAHLPGPDYHAALVPKYSRRFADLCRVLNVCIFTPPPPPKHYRRRFGWTYIDLKYEPRWTHKAPAEIPEVVFDVPAGVPAPRTSGAWKVKAIKLCMRLRERGYVTSKDFKEIGLSTTRWYQHWLQAQTDDAGRVVMEGRGYRWVPGPRFTDFAAAHPEVVDQLREKGAA